jgi:dUTP pyrophosphatase
MSKMLIKKLSKKAITPKKNNESDAGYDLFSTEGGTIRTNSYKIISTGISISLPKGFYGRIASRSGLASKNAIEVGAGVVDQGFTGEIKVILRNFGDTDFNFEENSKIAQMIITPYESPELEVVDFLPTTDRGEKGFGSSGV